MLSERSKTFLTVTFFLAAFSVVTLYAAFADDRTNCPNPSPCKILTLTAEEQKVLMDDKGILATAAAARNLDLGSLVTYFQQKIANAPAGDARPEAPKDQGKPAEPKP